MILNVFLDKQLLLSGRSGLGIAAGTTCTADVARRRAGGRLRLEPGGCITASRLNALVFQVLAHSVIVLKTYSESAWCGCCL